MKIMLFNKCEHNGRWSLKILWSKLFYQKNFSYVISFYTVQVKSCKQRLKIPYLAEVSMDTGMSEYGQVNSVFKSK